MHPIPSYQLIPFLEWLYNNKVIISLEHVRSGRLRELARDFLESRDVYNLNSIAGLMTIFQICPMISERTVEAQMEHFAGCGQCISMINEQFDVKNQSIYGPVHAKLHPLLSEFVEKSRNSSLERRVENVGRRFSKLPIRDELYLEYIINEIGDELLENFNIYLKEQQKQNPDIIQGFEGWRRNQHTEPQRQSFRHNFSDENTDPISPDDSPEQAVSRLVESARIAIEGGFYDQQIAKDPQIARFMALTMEGPENLAQALEFINWLQRREPELRITGNIPSSKLQELALSFCEDRGYVNAQSFAKEAQKWLSGAGSYRIIDRFSRLLGINRKAKRWQDGQNTPQNPLDRYGSVRFHGLFLFLSSGDFPGFLDSHWRDLHHLTGDHLDIYYSQSDLQDRTSGYEIIHELKSVEVRVDALPALLLWESQLKDARAIPLQELNYEGVVEVVKSIVQSIKDQRNIDSIVQLSTKRWRELQEAAHSGIIVSAGANLVINKGGIMGNVIKKYKNTGVVGAMGDNAVAHDNTFIQDARNALSEVKLTAADGMVIAKLAEALATQQTQHLQLTERLEGATQLAAIAQGAESGEPLEEAVAGWRQWLNSMGDRAMPVLSLLANVTTVATPIAKLLGLPL